MRDLATGRKNFLFSGSDASAQNGAFAYSLTQSCKLCDINPYVLINANRADFKVDAYMSHLWHK